MTARAFITGIAGTDIDARGARVPARGDAVGPHRLQAQHRDPGASGRLDGILSRGRGRDAPVLVDQEGGRVQRLAPPHWPAYPPGAAYGRLYDRDAAAGLAGRHISGARLIAADLVARRHRCGLPAGRRCAGGRRRFGHRRPRLWGDARTRSPSWRARWPRACWLAGVLPVLKHIPGHGRATADSHGELPVVEADRATLEATDFAAFRPLSDLPLGMTAHVVYTAIDPIAPATTSVTLVA